MAKKRRETRPTFGAVLEIPTPLWDTTRTRKMHEIAAKAAIKGTLMKFWRQKYRAHFKQQARHRYKHAERSKEWRRRKLYKYRSMIDLVMEGKTRTYLTTTVPKFSLAGGTIQGQTRGNKTSGAFGMTGRLTTKFPHPTNTKHSTRRDGKPSITPAVMASELSRWAEDEMRWAQREWIVRYQHAILTVLATSPKLKKKYGSRFAPSARRV